MVKHVKPVVSKEERDGLLDIFTGRGTAQRPFHQGSHAIAHIRRNSFAGERPQPHLRPDGVDAQD